MFAASLLSKMGLSTALLLCVVPTVARIARVAERKLSEITTHSSYRRAPVNVLPDLPDQFYGVLMTEAHLLNKTEDYPPWLRRVEIYYDFPNLRVKSSVLEGLDMNKTFLRRWDTQDEFMYRDKGDFPVCRRAFLSEPMPGPELAIHARKEAVKRAGTTQHNGRAVYQWTRQEYPARQQIYVDVETGVPFSVMDEFFEEIGAADAPDLEYPGQDPATRPVKDPPSPTANTWVPVMTYTFETMVVGPPESWPLPAGTTLDTLWLVPPPWRRDNRTKCHRHQGGWPYLHLFHHFLRV